MDERTLATYLDDHLAAATAAIAICQRLAKDHEQDPLGHDILGLEDEIQEDQALLTAARTKLPSDESVVKKAVGLGGSALDWARDRSPLSSAPSLLEDLEALAVGVWGKRLLWGTLARVAHSDERFADLDLDGLSARAEVQERTLLKLRATAIVEELELTG